MVFIYRKSRKSMKQLVYCGAFCLCAAGIAWNIETGLISMIAWVIFLSWDSLLHGRGQGKGKMVLTLVSHAATAVLAFFLMFGLLLFYTWSRSGSIPDFRNILFFQTLFYQYGFYMLPMPLIHPWNLVVLTYAVGICLGVGFLIRHRTGGAFGTDPMEQDRVSMVFTAAILGAGLFVGYQGRSHDYNLICVFWPAFFLLTIFSDVLWDRWLHRGADSRFPASRYTLLPLTLLTLFMLFFYTPYITQITPVLWKRMEYQIQSVIRPQDSHADNLAAITSFMKRYFSPGEEGLIFSEKYQTIFYISTETVNPVRSPSFTEIMLLSDLKEYFEYLERGECVKILMSDDFSQYDPDLYAYIISRFREEDRVGDLGFYVKEVAR
jgi:hypothetical protein